MRLLYKDYYHFGVLMDFTKQTCWWDIHQKLRDSLNLHSKENDSYEGNAYFILAMYGRGVLNSPDESFYDQWATDF